MEKEWDIVHRNGPTFETGRYRSNIDFFITKGIQAAGAKAPEDIRTGGTQHSACYNKIQHERSSRLPDNAESEISFKMEGDRNAGKNTISIP